MFLVVFSLLFAGSLQLSSPDKYRIAMFGPPGSGKSVQGKQIISHFGIDLISTGEILRSRKDDETVAGFLKRGELVPDHILLSLITPNLTSSNGFLLDGFPRTISQAISLDEILGPKRSLDAVLFFNMSEENAIKRLVNRKMCDECGRIHSGDQTRCECGSSVFVKREDDNEEVIRNRLQIFAKSIQPIKEYYQNKDQTRIISVDAGKTIDEIEKDILKALDFNKVEL